MIQEQKLNFWVKNNLNVLFTGKPGVGKTAIVKNTFEKNGLSYQYFSAPTMDPWVDLIGVPKESTDENGNKFLDLVRPKMFALDQINALFFDELNRAPAKVRNAVMELIQFRSINGKVFKNLRFIWAAINPEDEEKTYDVERLDPAQKDRFHVHVNIDYKPDKKYFFNKFGNDMGKAAMEWWNKIPVELKDSVTPRRLDYALEMFNLGGDLRDVLPGKVNVTKLTSMLMNGLASEKITKLYADGKFSQIEEMLTNDDIYAEVESWIISDKNDNNYIFTFLPAERITKFLSNAKTDNKTMTRLMSHYHTCPTLREVVISYVNTSSDSSIKSLILEAIPALESEELGSAPIEFSPITNENVAFTQFFEVTAKTEAWTKSVDSRSRIIQEAQGVPHNISSKDAKLVIVALIGCLKHSTSSVIRDSHVEIFGPLNFALQKANINLKIKESLGLESKVVINKLITAGVERFIWTPNS